MDLQTSILGLGSYVPETRITNFDLEKSLDTTDEWITSRTGIKARHIASKDQNTSDLCVIAARKAVENAGIAIEDIDAIIVATLSPDYMTPATACLVQHKLGLSSRGVPAFDVNAACSGFVYGLSTARGLIETGQAKCVLLAGGEVLSRFLDYQDRSTCILFGDGAGAAILGPATAQRKGHIVRNTKIFADGSGALQIVTPAGGSALPASAETLAERRHFIRVSGREVFRFAVLKVEEMIRDTFEKYGLKAQDLGAIVPHQANIRIIEAAAQRLELPMELFVTNLAEYGNTSAASIPVALDEADRAGRLPKGKPVLILAFGGGLTWGTALVDW